MGLQLTMYALIVYVCVTALNIGQALLLLISLFILNMINFILGMKEGMIRKQGILERGYEFLKNLEVERRRNKMEKDKDADIKE